jgi:predicted metal-dependent hydrolase
MAIINDDELGVVIVRKVSGSKGMRASVSPDGRLRVSVPSYAPLFVIRRMLISSRYELRALLDAQPAIALHDGMQIGKSHTLIVRQGQAFNVKRQANQVVVTVTAEHNLSDSAVVSAIRKHMQTILRKEANAHLPKRIARLAELHGFSYSSLRFTHASTRWGSCNAKKAISLNIALMGLPYELIDYVLLHELAHTVHLNHSSLFWKEVLRVDPHYVLHRKQLKGYNPTI